PFVPWAFVSKSEGRTKTCPRPASLHSGSWLLLPQKSPRHKRRAVATIMGKGKERQGKWVSRHSSSFHHLLSPPRRSPICLVNCRACSGLAVRCGGPLAEACLDVCAGFSLVRYFDPATLSCSDTRRTPRQGRERSRAEAA